MQLQCNLLPEHLPQILSLCESRVLRKTALVCKAWKEISKSLQFNRQIKSLPESLQKICNKGLFIINNNTYNTLSIRAEFKESVFRLVSANPWTFNFKNYTLILNEGIPQSLEHQSDTEFSIEKSNEEMDLFFKTIVGSLNNAKFENSNLEISGLDNYLVLTYDLD